MATYRDPVRVFAPLEMIERLLEIRADAGYTPTIFLRSADDFASYFDAYGFDVYRFDAPRPSSATATTAPRSPPAATTRTSPRRRIEVGSRQRAVGS